VRQLQVPETQVAPQALENLLERRALFGQTALQRPRTHVLTLRDTRQIAGSNLQLRREELRNFVRDALFPEFREPVFGELLVDSRNLRIRVQGRSINDCSGEQNCVLGTLESNRALENSLVLSFINESWMGEPHFRHRHATSGGPAEDLEKK
jgi:hypothetical protein